MGLKNKEGKKRAPQSRVGKFDTRLPLSGRCQGDGAEKRLVSNGWGKVKKTHLIDTDLSMPQIPTWGGASHATTLEEGSVEDCGMENGEV